MRGGGRGIRLNFGGARRFRRSLPATEAARVATSISITPASFTIAIGNTQQLSAQVLDQFGVDMGLTVTWSSSSPSNATVNSSGLVTAVASGTANITADFTGVSNFSAGTIQQATQLAMAVQPGGATTGSAFATQPVVQLRDASNQAVAQSGITINVALGSGGGSLSGTTSAVTNSSGQAVFTNLAITGTGDHSLSFTSTGLTGIASNTFSVSGAGSATTFAAPDLGSYSVTTGTDAFLDYGNPIGTTYITANATAGRSGSRALQAAISPANDGSFNPVGRAWTSRGRAFVRYYMRTLTSTAPSGNVKGMRFHTNNGNQGDMPYSNLKAAFDFEPLGLEGVTWETGITYGGAGGVDAPVVPTAIDLNDTLFHCFEVDYDRNAGANCEVAYWLDQVPCIYPNGNATSGFGVSALGQWVGGEARTLTPTRLRVTRQNASVIDGMTWYETISQSGAASTIIVDDMAVSSARIGPCSPGSAGTPAPLYEQWVNAGGALAIGGYASGRWIYVDGSGSEIVVSSGGGSIEILASPSSTNAHIQYAASDLPTQDYAIVTALRYRTGGNQLSEAYVYMPAGENSGYFMGLGGGAFSIYRLDDGIPTQIQTVSPSGTLTNGNWYVCRLDAQTLSDRVRLTARLYHVENTGNQFPVTITVDDTSGGRYTSGKVGCGGFFGPGGTSVGVGHIIVTHRWGI